jgi:omega-6 fatty acid desaturase (delta-12 desaturase)
MNGNSSAPGARGRAGKAPWSDTLARYRRSSARRALWQLATTLIPYLLLWWVIYQAAEISLWLTIPPAILAGAFLMRLFIIFHDCGHGSYFTSGWANDIVGLITGALTLTPYDHWRWQHAIHHGTTGHLDKRGTGDIWTMTVQEYLASSRWRRLAYWLSRNPVVLFALAPFYLFLIDHRFASRHAGERQRRSVHWTNVVFVTTAVSMSWIFGLGPYLLIQATIMLVAGATGIWLFYVQHQFEDAYWERGDNWDYTAAALRGSSFYKLPRVLQWFSANIGFHHIHHLSPRIPNYNLQKCHEGEPVFQQVRPITLASSLNCLRFHFWDERSGKLVGFARVRQLRRQQRQHELQRRKGTDAVCRPQRASSLDIANAKAPP